MRPVTVGGVARVVRDEGVRVNRHRKTPRVPAGGSGRLPVVVDQGDEAGRRAANDGDDKRQPKPPGAFDRCRVPADADPDRELFLCRPRVDPAVVDARPVVARPGHALVLTDGEQQVELLFEELVVVIEVVAEERV